MKSVLAATILGTAMMTTAFAQAAPETNHSGVLSLDAQAVAEVPTDTVTLTLSAEQEGADPGAISTTLSRKADEVINQAKRTSGVQAETGGFNIYPNTDRNGKISVWRGRAEVRITSKDFAAASKLAGQLANQMQVQNVNFTLSREARTAAAILVCMRPRSPISSKTSAWRLMAWFWSASPQPTPASRARIA